MSQVETTEHSLQHARVDTERSATVLMRGGPEQQTHTPAEVSSERGNPGTTGATDGRLDLVMVGPALSVMGGVSAVERLILAELPQQIHATHIATMVDGSKGAKLLEYARALWRFCFRAGRQADLIHIHFSSRASSARKEFLARLALARGAKVIMHAHGAEYRMYWQEMTDRQRARSLDVLCRADALIVLGEVWREFFVAIGVPAEKIAVMPNPVRLPRQVPARVETGRVTCAYLGIISRRKGAFDLVEAVASLPPACRQRLRIVVAGNGKGPELREIIGRQSLNDCIEVHDWLNPDQRDELLAAAQIFVLPSYNEGLPMALLEAMAYGLAPICTPVGSIAEVVTHDSNGLLVEPGDIAALAAALQRLTENPEMRARLAARARSTVEPLGVESYIVRLCALYRSVVHGERHRKAV